MTQQSVSNAEKVLLKILEVKESKTRPPIRVEYIQYLSYMYQHDYTDHQYWTDWTKDTGPISQEVIGQLESLNNKGLVFKNPAYTFGGDERVSYRLSTDGRQQVKEVKYLGVKPRGFG